MRFKDMKQVVKMLDSEWNLGKKESEAKGNICAWIYLMEILIVTEQFVMYKENGKILGIGGYSKNNSKKHLFRKKCYKYVLSRLYRSKKIQNIDGLKAYYDTYNYVPKEMINAFDGELSILIVDEKHRNKGIGKKIVSSVFELAKEDGIKKLQILTDGACSYKFYESVGCNKVYETIIENKEVGKLGNISQDKAYIYEKNIV